MIPTDDLTCAMVLVNPGLVNDPAGNQNQIGRIVKADLAADEITVDFGDDHPALYSADALLMLKDSERLFQLLEDLSVLSEKSRRGIYGIALILHHGYEEAPLMSLKICRQNPGIRDLVLESAQDVLTRQQNPELGR